MSSFRESGWTGNNSLPIDANQTLAMNKCQESTQDPIKLGASSLQSDLVKLFLPVDEDAKQTAEGNTAELEPHTAPLTALYQPVNSNWEMTTINHKPQPGLRENSIRDLAMTEWKRRQIEAEQELKASFLYIE